MAERWERVWLVIETPKGELKVSEREAMHLPHSHEWAVSMRAIGCRSKRIELVPDALVSRTEEAAMVRLRAMMRGR